MVQNSFLFIGLLVLCFGAVLVLKKLFGKAGLFVWIAIGSIISNITAASVGVMFGIPWDATLANVTFAATMVANQILTLCYGETEGKKGVYLGLISSIMFVGLMFLFANIVPGDSDPGVSILINELFGFKDNGLYCLCNTVASVIMAYLANLIDVKILAKLTTRKKSRWTTTIVGAICNCTENFGFVIAGLFLLPNLFYSINSGLIDSNLLMSFEDCIFVALTTCIFEIPLSLLNTPMNCLAKRIKATDEKSC